MQMMSRRKFGSLVLGVLGVTQLPLAAQKPAFTVGWSVYVGWNPYYYMAKSGIMKKWADKYGISHQGAAVRLRAVARSVRREEYRRLRHDQHGSARHAGGVGRGHDGDSSWATTRTATTPCSRVTASR